jgi:hypothetical protein
MSTLGAMRTVSILGVLGILAACAGGGPTTGSTGGSSSGGATGAGGNASTGTGGTGGLPYSGEVVLYGATGTPFNIAASFTTTTTPFSMATRILDPCTGASLAGSCCYRGLGGTSTSSGLSPTVESAGTLIVADGSSRLGTLPFSGGYATLFTGISWNAGDTISVSASGATVDAFNGSVQIPGAMVGLTPVFSRTSPLAVALSSNLVISWTPDSAAGERVNIDLDDGTNGYIYCSTTDVSGSVSVSSSLLSHFSSGDTADIGIARIASATPADANTSVTLIAELPSGFGHLALQ